MASTGEEEAGAASLQQNRWWHGTLSAGRDFAEPDCVTEFDVAARDYGTGIKAHEYLDRPEVLAAKVRVLADLLRRSKHTLAYTGAGISTAAGIDDYATKAKSESLTAAGRPVVKDWKNAEPTLTHRVLAGLERAGHLHHWVQQNHDSLPQKAGFPQWKLNEIHGSLHDVANSIVPYEGTLRDDLFAWMHEETRRADLCLALGTSMSGFNCDSVPEKIGVRHVQSGRGLGLVIVNLQQTTNDRLCALRIFARTDDVFRMLADEMAPELAGGVVPPAGYSYRVPEALLASARAAAGGEEDVFPIPSFDPDTGLPAPKQGQAGGGTTWDLRPGARIRLTGGVYEGDIGEVVEKNARGDYRVRFAESYHPIFKVRRATFSLWLGSWWIECAMAGHGIVPGGKIPFVNVLIEGGTTAGVDGDTAAADDDAPTPDRDRGGALDVSKFETMLKIRVPEQAVRNKMAAENFSEESIAAFFASRGAPAI